MKKLKRYIRMDEHLYEMANLTKEDTGLNYIVWISPRTGKEKHCARIKVQLNMEFIPVTIEDVPRIAVKKNVEIPNFKKLQKWIVLNKDLLLQYWNSNGEMSLKLVFKNLKKV